MTHKNLARRLSERYSVHSFFGSMLSDYGGWKNSLPTVVESPIGGAIPAAVNGHAPSRKAGK